MDNYKNENTSINLTYKKDKIHEELNNYKYSPLRITLIYLFFGAVWVLSSDVVLSKIVSNQALLSKINIIKGWFYVAVTAVLVYSLISRLIIRIHKQENKLIDSYEELSETYKELEVSKQDLQVQYKVLVEYKEKLYKLAYQDHLTLLPNRRLFYHDLSKKINEAKEDECFVLLLIDVDNFKYVNDIYGHDYGDKTLLNISQRIQCLINDHMKLYRIGGDEFAIYIEGKADLTFIHQFASSIIDDFKKNLHISTKTTVSMSIGISMFPETTKDLNDLVKFADVALYKAKDAGKGTYSIFEASLKRYMDEKILFEEKLKLALANDEFILHFQPQVDFNTGEIRGFEALIRWVNEDLGFVPPNRFIPIAEETKIIIEIGEWVLKTAIEFGSKLNMGDKKYIISVNISVVQWMQDNFVEVVENALKDYQFSEEYLELEITESILIHSFDQTISKLHKLREKGIKVALDDFGTGYSSLNYLKELPISTLKIDKTFIDDILVEKSKNEHILNAIITLGHQFGLEVIAEGVETQEQLSYLYNNKCDTIQGYIYSKPLDQQKIDGFISSFDTGYDGHTKCIIKREKESIHTIK
ncbi:MAG: diguanylate cyclase [Firmicutes bacterium HGW-Firmicutes-1]|jgi:diguanylate cyclase (GGDEF)-like protein|nr:MAG: diguanylate cyclase [Firmicutes bacterium HGW-Firmicutes-1]